jgi:hypothetical protein
MLPWKKKLLFQIIDPPSRPPSGMDALILGLKLNPAGLNIARQIGRAGRGRRLDLV